MKGLACRKSKERPDALFVVIAAVNLAIGFCDGLFSNYFKDVYNATAFSAGCIEFPRELPGVIVFFLSAPCRFFGDITLAVVAQVLAAFALFGAWLLYAPSA